MSSILSLSTAVEPAKKFDIDDQEYDLLGVEHLSPDQEAEVTAKFSRFDLIATRLSRATSDKEAKNLAAQLRERRVELITLLTTVPADIAEKLPPSAQTQLFKAVAEEYGQDDGDGSSS